MRDNQLQNRPGTGSYLKGKERIVKILEAARDILIYGGYAKLSMRKIATAAGMTIGNLHYYYPSKKDLIAGLLDYVIRGYLHDFENARKQAGQSPEDQFIAVISLIIEDLTTRETTNFFPELWAMANHDEMAAERMHELYRKGRQDTNELIGLLNPALSVEEREQVSLFISASMEVLTPFIGDGKPWQSKTQEIINIAAYSFLHLVKSIDSKEIAAQPPSH